MTFDTIEQVTKAIINTAQKNFIGKLNQIFSIVTKDCNHRFLNSLIGEKTSGGLASLYTRPPETRPSMSKNGGKKCHGILHVLKWILSGGYLDFTVRPPKCG